MANFQTILKKVGSKIKKLRAEQEMTQYALAESCNFEKASMSRIESGQSNVTLLTLFKISNALDVPILELLKD